MQSGIHSGAAVVQRLSDGPRRYSVIGPPVQAAYQLAARATPDELLLSPDCQRLVAPYLSTSPCPWITFDLDGLDPACLPGTGTPEPGGLDWYEASDLIGAVAAKKRIVGFDVVELAPIAGDVASDFLAARMTYRMIGHMLASQR